MDYQCFEAALADASGKLERAVHHDALRSLDVDAEQVLIAGALYTKVGRIDALI